MIAIVTILAAFPLGYFVRSRLAAFTAYAIAYLWAFTFQTLYLLIDGVFDDGEFPLSYGLVTLGIFAAGFSLVHAGQWVRSRRAGAVASPSEAITG